jgi:ribosomal protein S8
MKYIFILLCVITTITSCKTREIISKELISEYNLTDETLLGTEVYITDPVRMVFDTIVQTPDNRKGFISVSENHIIKKVNVRLQSKGVIKSVDYIGKNLVVGVLFKKKAEPIYFSLNKRGTLELVVIKNRVKYNEVNYELVSNEIPYLEVIVKKNKRSSKSKVTMTGY